jgi:hypothetical protein
MISLGKMTLIIFEVARLALEISKITVCTTFVDAIASISSAWCDKLELAFMKLRLNF